MTIRQRAAQFYAATVFSRADLTASGMTSRDITRAIDSGRLRRLRRDRYAIEPVSAAVAEAVRIGGRLSCVSLLVEIGVFVHLRDVLHVHVRPGSSRVRRPQSKHTLLHWNTWSGDPEPLHAAALADAVAQAVRCQQPRAAVATLDSIMHHGLMSWDEVLRVFEWLPKRYRPLLALVDSSAESGPETFMRLLLRALGVTYETQVVIDGVGRVDFLVEGWLIIECDSKEFHEGWEKQVDDRRRDLAAATKGYITIRPLASDILRRDSALRETVDAVIRSLGPHFRNGARAQLLKK
ncbi:endonuclease domain-containing protein [Microbacterium paraoxydans]|uniref:endonuclease domain-containing protein n=1 Tax=Microbacterium paraoxydans TaxID=199592 RepID=UPI001CFA42DF|nr:endonuclease domain-containing protein [Microbacterium paraoxydans]